ATHAASPLLFLTRCDNAQRLVELECQDGFRGHFDRTALGQDLREGAGTSAGTCTDRRALPASSDSSDDCADGPAAAGIFSCSLVGSQARFALLDEIGGT